MMHVYIYICMYIYTSTRYVDIYIYVYTHIDGFIQVFNLISKEIVIHVHIYMLYILCS